MTSRITNEGDNEIVLRFSDDDLHDIETMFSIVKKGGSILPDKEAMMKTIIMKDAVMKTMIKTLDELKKLRAQIESHD